MPDDMDRFVDALRAAAGAMQAATKSQQLPLNKTLWTREQVADYLGAESRTTLDRIMAKDGFPKPKAIGHGRWIAQDVIDWAAEQ